MIGMIYKEKYKEFTEDELVELLKDYQHLNFEAKVQLKETIGGNVPHGYEVEFEKLSEAIDEETKGLDNLSYLENLGYKLKEINETSNFEIARSRMAKFIDVLSIILAFIFVLQIKLAQPAAENMLDGVLTAGGFFNVLLRSVVAIVGIILFHKASIRIINLWKFKIKKTDLGIEIKKRLDIGDLFDRQIDPAGLQAIHREEKCVLVYRDGSTEVDLLETNATHRAMQTFEAIKNRLTA